MEPYLTPRQTAVIRLVSLGFSNEEIAHILGLAVSTADNHRASAMAALGTEKAFLMTRLAIKYLISSMKDMLTSSGKRKCVAKGDGWN